MSRKRSPMRRIKEVLRMHFLGGFVERQIALAAQLKKSTVHDYLVRAKQAGLAWDKAEQLNDDEIEKLLFPLADSAFAGKALPDWGNVHRELRRKGVTLELLWSEYREHHPMGYGYSRFCELYQQAAPRFDLSMRQIHRAGEKLFVDYSGLTIGIINKDTGEIMPAQVFVAVFGASNYTYAEATWTQTLPDWIGSHVRPSSFLVVFQLPWCQTIYAGGSAKLGSTTRKSIRPTSGWPLITRLQSFRLALAAQRTKPRSK